MRKEKGAIVAEATIALTAFIFMIFTILSIVNICYIQAKMAVSLNAAAKEISQYSYLYYAIGADELDASLSEGTEDSVELGKHTIDGVGTFMDSLNEAENGIKSADFDKLMNAIDTGAESVDGLVNEYGDAIGDDPKQFLVGMGKMALNEGKETVKSQVLGKVMAKAFMKKNLMEKQNGDPDAFLKRYHVQNGMDGLDFTFTTFLAHGTSNKIQLVVTYKVDVIKLLNLDFHFTIRQCSKTTAWGNGISLLHPEQNKTEPTDNGKSIWDMENQMERGQIIVAKEKEKYTYTDSGSGFDAYNNEGGKNEFITIISTDTHCESYNSVDGLKNKLSAAYSDMYDKVSGLDEQITVTDKDGKEVTVNSDPTTRSYTIEMVVPDDADRAMVMQAIREFEAAHPGVKVKLRDGYGSPSPEEPAPEKAEPAESTPEKP